MMVNPLGPLGPMLGFALLGALALAASYPALPRADMEARMVSADPDAPSLVAVWRRKGIGRHLNFGLLLCSAQAINLYTIGFVIIDRMPAGAAAALAADCHSSASRSSDPHR